jgi:hypothetical protein
VQTACNVDNTSLLEEGICDGNFLFGRVAVLVGVLLFALLFMEVDSTFLHISNSQLVVKFEVVSYSSCSFEDLDVLPWSEPTLPADLDRFCRLRKAAFAASFHDATTSFSNGGGDIDAFEFSFILMQDKSPSWSSINSHVPLAVGPYRDAATQRTRAS